MLDFQDVSVDFAASNGSTVHALDGISFSVSRNELVAIIGPSGCGKTTLLRLAAGFEEPTLGEVQFQGRPVMGPGRERGMIFQHHSSFSWLTVAQNIAFGLQLADQAESKIAKTVQHYLAMTGLSDFSDSYPDTLSGGMRQRVAFARTLANNPKLVLLDEPFGALDAQTRMGMQDFLARLIDQERKTMVLVTHDIEEAIYLADRIVVLAKRPGTIKEIIDVGLDRPRKPAIKFSSKFLAHKKHLLALLS